jgi:hypothetical protein
MFLTNFENPFLEESFLGATMMTAVAASGAATASVAATNASMNTDSSLLGSTKSIASNTWKATSSDESLKNMAISAVVAGVASWAAQASGGKPNLEAGARADSKVGVNTVEKDGIIFKEMPGQPGVPSDIKVDMSNYDSLGGYGSRYNNNPIFQSINTLPSAPSGAAGHDAFVDKLILNGTLDPSAASTPFFVGASAPPYLILNACASSPSLCAIYVNTRTDKDFLQSSNSKQQP